MSLNFTGGAAPTSLGLGSALPTFDANAVPAYTPTPPSFDPVAGVTRFQGAYAQKAGLAAAQPEAAAGDFLNQPQDESRYYYGIYQPQFRNRMPGGKGGRVEVGQSEFLRQNPGYSIDNGFLYVPADTVGPRGIDTGLFMGGAYQEGYGPQGVADNGFFSVPQEQDAWWMNSGGLVRRGDGPPMKGYNEGGIAMADTPPIDQNQDESEELINMALMAMDPNSGMPEDDRQAILALFEEVFGPGSVEALREEYMGTDEVPAMLTPGEVVVPKNKVLGAGAGDPEAGASNIMQVVDELNQLQGGEPADALGGAGGIAAALGGR